MLLAPVSLPAPSTAAPAQSTAAPAQSTATSTTPAHRSEPLKAAVSQNEMTDKLESLGIKTLVRLGAKTTISVDSVRMGSKAFYKGVAVGDLIKGLVQSGDTFCLNIERDGKPYQIIFKGVAQKASLDQVKAAPALASKTEDNRLLGGTSTPDAAPREKALLKYDIEILIDISGSMNEVDGSDGLSKFEWCHRQIRDLSRRLAPYKRSLTITTFNQGFQTEGECSAERVEAIFGSTTPGGNTNLLDPLNAALERARSVTSRGTAQSQRRALVAVITDGMPNIPRNPHEVNDLIVSFTQTMKDPDQIVVVFLQVGDNFNGQQFCSSLDNSLLHEGARYDIVETQTFAQLKGRGLANTLVDAIVDSMARRAMSSRSGLSAPANDDLEAIRKERARIEKQLLGH